MKNDYSNIIAQGMKEIVDSEEHSSLFFQNIKKASAKCATCNQDEDSCMCWDKMPADDSNLTPWQIACKKHDEARDAALEHYTNARKLFDDDRFEAKERYDQAINIAREEWEEARKLVRKEHHAHHTPDETGHGGHNDNNDDIDEILSEASVASAVESLVKASANLERLGFKRGAAEALTIASIVVEAKKKKDNKKKMKMKMKMMREKMMKDKKDSSSKNSKSDSSKSNSSSSIPEFLKKKIKFAQVSDPKLAPYKNISRRFIDFIDENSNNIPVADLLKIKPALYRFKESIGSYTSDEIYGDVTNIIDMISNISGRENSKVEEFKNKAQSYKAMFNQPSDDLSRINLIEKEKINPAYLETLQAPPKQLTIKSPPASYSQYVNQLDTGLKFLINKIGPTSDPKISGEERKYYLNQLNKIIKEIDRVYWQADDATINIIAPLVGKIQSSFSGDDVSKMSNFGKLSSMMGSSLSHNKEVSASRYYSELKSYADSAVYPPYQVANPGPVANVSNPSFPYQMDTPNQVGIKGKPASYSQYVNQLDTGLKFLINKLGPTSQPKISGQDRQNYLNKLNTMIKEINRMDAILSKQNSAESRQLQDKLLTMNQSLRDGKLSGDDIAKLTALNSNAQNFSQPSTTVPQQPSAEQVKGMQDYAANLTESFGAPAVTRPGTT